VIRRLSQLETAEPAPDPAQVNLLAQTPLVFPMKTSTYCSQPCATVSTSQQRILAWRRHERLAAPGSPVNAPYRPLSLAAS
jgi:hypothetical protein